MHRRQFLRGLTATLAAALLHTHTEGTTDMEEGFLGRRNILTDIRRIQGSMGTFRAAGGLVVINEDGIYVYAGTAYDDVRAYKFVDSSENVVSTLEAYLSAVTNAAHVWVKQVADHTGTLWLKADADDDQISQAVLEAEHPDSGNYADIFCEVDATDSSFIQDVVDDRVGYFVLPDGCYGNINLDATAGNDLRLQADWEVTYAASRRDLKTNLAPHQADRALFMALQPMTYNAVSNPDGAPIVGLVAEDVQAVYPDMATYVQKERPKPRQARPDKPPELMLASYDDKQILVEAVSVIQQQQREIDALQADVAMLKAALDIQMA